jgi:hypothetical protein
MALMGMMDHPLVKTILHEFAHVACNGNPPVSPAGLETYYHGSLPGQTANVLTEADSYAWFAMEAGGIGSEGRPQQRPGRSRLPWLIPLGLGALFAVGGLLGAPGLFVGAALGGIIGGLGLLGAFD